MICGPAAHDYKVPLSPSHQQCALSNLEQHYSFVAVTERYTESVCVLAAMLGIPPAKTRTKNDKATTGSKGAPPDFKQVSISLLSPLPTVPSTASCIRSIPFTPFV